jgi:4-alpha-glucanotransferase
VNFYLRVTPGSMPEALIRAALGSVGKLAIIPMQDVLGLGSEARLNTPGTAVGNWSWKLPADALNGDLARHFSLLNRAYGRV